MSDEPEQKRVADFDQLYPGRFLKAGLLQGRKVTLTIADVWLEKLTTEKGPQWKGVVRFEKSDLELVLNKTNGTCLKAMFGRELSKWVGHRVTLFPMPNVWKGEPAIRVWGSPELKEDQDVTINMPRKKPVVMTLHAVKQEPKGTAGGAPATGGA